MRVPFGYVRLVVLLVILGVACQAQAPTPARGPGGGAPAAPAAQEAAAPNSGPDPGRRRRHRDHRVAEPVRRQRRPGLRHLVRGARLPDGAAIPTRTATARRWRSAGRCRTRPPGSSTCAATSKWHDGSPFTAADVVHSHRSRQERPRQQAEAQHGARRRRRGGRRLHGAHDHTKEPTASLLELPR